MKWLIVILTTAGAVGDALAGHAQDERDLRRLERELRLQRWIEQRRKDRESV